MSAIRRLKQKIAVHSWRAVAVAAAALASVLRWHSCQGTRHIFLAEATMKTHVGRMLGKLDLRDRVQAVVYAYEHGLVRPQSRLSTPPS